MESGNNFWEKTNWENKDPHLGKLQDAPFQRPFPNFNFENGLYIIRGPRQIGKTTWLKRILQQALKEISSEFLFLL